jgi:peptidoglycan hydrolase-like protein with peptidoglycan-binding domain
MNRLLYRGCTSGEDVQILQNDLNAVTALPSQKSGLAPLDADGVFGPKTAGRVQEFQALKGQTADGVVGSKTLGSLCSLLQQPPGTPALHPPPGRPAPVHPMSGGIPIYSGGPPYGKMTSPSGTKTYSTSGTKGYGGSGAGGGSGSGSGGSTKSW